MASGTVSARPEAESAPAQGRYEDFIQKRLEHTRRQVRLVDVVTSLMLLATASLLFFLAVAVLDHWVFKHGLGFIARLGLFALWVAGAGTFVWRFLLPPLASRINPVFAAHTIEQGRPTLKNSLINLLLLRSHPKDVAPVVYRAMEYRAAADLLKVPVDHAVDRSRIVHLACVLAAVIGVFVLYLALSPKNPLLSVGRVLWPWSSVPVPTRVHIGEVSPGDAVVFNDDHQQISAQVTGLRDGEEVVLLVSTADGQVVDDRVVMTRADDANRYGFELPPESGGFQQDTFYRITAGDAATPQYKLEVHTAPTIMIDRIDYHFPPYTEQTDRTIKNQGDIKALEGTQVTIHATANMDIQDATIDLGCAGLRTLAMTTTGTKATGQFTLALDPDDKAGKAQYDRYQILFTDTDGHKVRRPVQYHIDVDPDLKPEISIDQPQQEEVAVAEDGQLRIRVGASDPDYGLRHVTLQAECNGQNLGLPVLLDRTKPAKALAKRFESEPYPFRPAELKLKAGDLVTYWATAEDNKEPRPNHSETAHRTIKIVASGQQEQQNQPNGADGQPQANENKPGQGSGKRDKTEEGKGGSPSKAEGSKDSDHPSDEKSKKGDKEDKPQDPQHNDRNNQDQPENGGGPGKKQTSSDQPNPQNSGEPKSGEASDEPKKIDPETQKTDAIKTSLDDLEKEKKDQQKQPDKSSGDKKQDQKQGSGLQDPNQPGNPQQGGQNQGDKKQNGDQGAKQPQDNSGEKNSQGGGNPQPQAGGQQPQGGKPDAAENNSGQGNSGQKPQGDQQSPSGQGNPKSSPQHGNAGDKPNAGSQSQDNKNSGNQPSGNQSSPQNAGGGKSSESKPFGGSKESQSAGGQSKPDSKQAGGEKAQQNQSAGGDPKSEEPQSGNKGAGEERQTAQSGSKPDEKKQPGGQGTGDEKQVAQAGPKPDEKKPSGSDGAGSQNLPGGEKPGNKPKAENSNSQSGGQGSQSKKEEKKQDGGGQSSGGDQPKPGQGEQQGSSGAEKSGGKKPGGKQGGTGDGEHEGQKNPGTTGEPTQDSSKAPDPQTDNAPGEKKAGDSNNAAGKPNDPQSPGNSDKTSDSKGDSQGDRKGGGGAGGGGDQHSKKNGTGVPGSHSAAEQGGSVSDEQGPGATGTKAGEDVRSTDQTGSSRKEPGKGNGKTQQPTDKQTAKDDSQKPNGDSSQNSAPSEEKSSGGQSGAQSSQQAGTQGAGLPAGGSQASSMGKPPATHEPEGEPDAANLEFSKKQVDLALEHLKDQMAKEKPELLDRLGWTKEEGWKFLENMKKLKDSAQQSGNQGEAGKKAYNEFLKNLDLHPHGTRLEGGKTQTDDVRNVRDSGQMEPPSDWADLYRAYSRSTAGQK